MYFNRSIFTALAAVAISTASLAHAGVVYDNGGPNRSNGYSIHGSEHTYDDFLIADGAAVTGVGFYFNNYTGVTGWDGNVNYQILSDSSGAPGSVLASGAAQNVASSDSGLPWCCAGQGSVDAFLVTFDLQSAFAAQAGTRYWLDLSGATGSNPAAWWVTANANGTPGGTAGNDFAFYLTDGGGGGDAPEPATMTMLALGCAAIGLAKLRRRQ